MSKKPEIKCYSCGHQFETFAEDVIRYEDREPYTETVYYPTYEEEATSVHNEYFCKKCYGKIPEFIKDTALEGIDRVSTVKKLHMDNLYDRYMKDYNKEKAEYERDISAMDKIRKMVEDNLVDEESINSVKEEIPYDSKYLIGYLSDIDEWNRREKGEKPIYEHLKDMNLVVTSYPKGMLGNKTMKKADFLDILMDFVIKGKTPREILQIIENEKKI